jgi:hypothetical protein
VSSKFVLITEGSSPVTILGSGGSGGSSVPIPGAVWLLGSGLLGLIGLKRKFLG